MPGLVKIGKTTRRPQLRAQELAATTGVPVEFRVEHYWQVPTETITQIERQTHRVLRDYRVNQRREFFQIVPAEAKQLIERTIIRRGVGMFDSREDVFTFAAVVLGLLLLILLFAVKA